MRYYQGKSRNECDCGWCKAAAFLRVVFIVQVIMIAAMLLAYTVTHWATQP